MKPAWAFKITDETVDGDGVVCRVREDGSVVYRDPTCPGMVRPAGGTWRVYRARKPTVDLHTQELFLARKYYRELAALKWPRGGMRALMGDQTTELAVAWDRMVASKLLHSGKSSAAMYRRLGLRIVKFFGPRGHVAQIETKDLRRWVDHELLTCHPNTVRQRLGLLRCAWKWFMARGLVAENIVVNSLKPRELPTPGVKKERVWPEEFYRLRSALQQIRQPLADWATIMWTLALRPSEVNRLRMSSLHRESRCVKIISSKANKWRTVPVVDDELWHVLVRWASRKTRPNYHSLSLALVATSNEILGKEITAKQFRHSRITQWLDEGCAPVDVQRWAGHSNVMMTMSYVREDKRAVQMPLRSLDGLRKQDASPKADHQRADGGNDEGESRDRGFVLNGGELVDAEVRPLFGRGKMQLGQV